MINCFFRSFAAFFDKRFLSYIIYSILLSAIALFFLNYAIFSFIEHSTLFNMSWLEVTNDLATKIMVFVITLTMFPILLPIILGFFEDSLINTTKKKYYSDLENIENKNQTLASSLLNEIKFSLKLFAINLIIIPPSIFLPFIYYAINGHLIGKRYFQIVAMMHLKKDDANLFIKKHRFIIFICGIILVLGMTLPIINLFVPFFMIIFIVHLFYKLI